jgi:hypothetical protein
MCIRQSLVQCCPESPSTVPPWRLAEHRTRKRRRGEAPLRQAGSDECMVAAKPWHTQYTVGILIAASPRCSTLRARVGVTRSPQHLPCTATLRTCVVGCWSKEAVFVSGLHISCSLQAQAPPRPIILIGADQDPPAGEVTNAPISAKGNLETPIWQLASIYCSSPSSPAVDVFHSWILGLASATENWACCIRPTEGFQRHSRRISSSITRVEPYFVTTESSRFCRRVTRATRSHTI